MGETNLNRQGILLILLGIVLIYFILDYTVFNKKAGIPETSIRNNLNDNADAKSLTQINLINKMIPKSSNKEIPAYVSWGRDIFTEGTSMEQKTVAAVFFSLTGISTSERGNTAIINGDIFTESMKINGYTVHTISDSRVVLKKKGKKNITLKIGEEDHP